MNFIEKVVGIMKNSPEPEAPVGSNPETEGEDGPDPDVPATDEAAQEDGQQSKTYTSEEVENLLSEKKKEWLEECEAKEQERLRSLPESERLKQEQLSKNAEINRLRAELMKRDLQAEIIAKLNERKLPIDIKELVQYGDRESTMESYDKITTLFINALNKAVTMRLRGKTPEGLGGSSSYMNQMKEPFALALQSTFNKEGENRIWQ